MQNSLDKKKPFNNEVVDILSGLVFLRPLNFVSLSLISLLLILLLSTWSSRRLKVSNFNSLSLFYINADNKSGKAFSFCFNLVNSLECKITAVIFEISGGIHDHIMYVQYIYIYMCVCV